MKRRHLLVMGWSAKQGKHRHVTRAEDYTVAGGDKEFHEQLQEKSAKFMEKLKKHDNVCPERLAEISREVGL